MYKIPPSIELEELLSRLRDAAEPRVVDGIERMPLPSEMLAEHLGVPVVAMETPA